MYASYGEEVMAKVAVIPHTTYRAYDGTCFYDQQAAEKHNEKGLKVLGQQIPKYKGKKHVLVQSKFETDEGGTGYHLLEIMHGKREDILAAVLTKMSKACLAREIKYPNSTLEMDLELIEITSV